MERLTKVMDKYLSEAKKKVLTLTVSKEWFDMIVSGEKNEEYRVIKDFWMSRLLLIKDEEFKDFDKYDKLHIGKTFEMLIDINTIKEKLNNGTMKFVPFTHVLFKNGYYDDSPKVEKEIESITIGKPKKGLCPGKWLNHEFSLLSSSDMIAIKVSSENIQELWKCPDVSELVKTVSGDCTKQTLIVRLRNREFYVPDGFYLVKDDNDQWSTLSPSLYELIKDKVHGEK